MLLQTGPETLKISTQLQTILFGYSICERHQYTVPEIERLLPLSIISMNEKRLTNAFRNFVERVFLPSFKKTDPQSLQWNKFSRMLSSDTLNYEEITQYSDSISANIPNTPTSLEKKDMPFMRKNLGEQGRSPQN